MTLDELTSLARASARPIEFALRWASMGGPAEEAGALVRQCFLEADTPCDASEFRAVTRFAKDLRSIRPEAAQALEAALESSNRPAALLYRAAGLEASKEFAAAAGIFEKAAAHCAGSAIPQCLEAWARCALKAGEAATAWGAAIQAVRASSSFPDLNRLERLVAELGRRSPVPSKRKLRVALAGSTTLDFCGPILRLACLEREMDAEIHLGGFGAFQQEIRDPNSSLAQFRPDVIILAPDWRSLGLGEENPRPDEVVREKLGEFQELWALCREQLRAFVIQHNFEVPMESPYGRLSALLPGGRARVLQRLNLRLAEEEARLEGLAILDIDHIAGCFGKNRWSDPRIWHLARQYPANEALPSLVRHQAALLAATCGLARKCVVLDLDGTLWGGVVGEDGVDRIQLGGTGTGEAYVEFQRHLLALKRRGVILCVCSKNEEADAMAPFLSHPEMVLKIEDIVVFRANWKSKDENIREIAATLNIGLDAVVFLDDNPAERLLVARSLPEVRVVDLPPDPSLYIRALDSLLLFESLKISDEDRQRSGTYRENMRREESRQGARNVSEYLASLEMAVELAPFDSANLGRITQLINKTNQFNLTTRRLTEVQVEELTANPSVYTQAMRVRDRFGDNGLTGVLIAVPEGRALRIDTWLMSCRVLGRNLDLAMFHSLVRFAADQGWEAILGDYLPTPKNSQVADEYSRLGFGEESNLEGGGRRYRLHVAKCGLEAPPAYIAISDRTRKNPRAPAVTSAEGSAEGDTPTT